MSATLALPRELTIYTVGELFPQWLDWLHTPGNHSVDAKLVEEADAAGVQLLLSLAHALEADARTLQLQDASPALVAACTALGLDTLTGATA